MFDERFWKDPSGAAMPRRSPIPTQSVDITVGNGAASTADQDFTGNPLRGVWIGDTAGILEVQLWEDTGLRQYKVAANSRWDGIIVKLGKNSTAGVLQGLR